MKKLINSSSKKAYTIQEFHLKNTLLNGQCFNWDIEVENGEDKEVLKKQPNLDNFIGVFRHWLVRLQQKNGEIYYSITPESKGSKQQEQDTFEPLFQNYLQSEVDVVKLCREWSEQDPHFKVVHQKIYGLRVLQQDPVECFFSFMVSQNNNIPRITKCLQSIREKYGQFITEYKGRQFYSFPTLIQLQKASEAELKELGLGYRARYIVESVKQLEQRGGEQFLIGLREQPYQKVREELLKFTGVGAKVADCISLFSLNCNDLVPVDTHVWQIYQKHYVKSGKRSQDNKKMGSNEYQKVSDFFNKMFGDYAGWAHSHLFTADLSNFQNFEEKTEIMKKKNNNIKNEEEDDEEESDLQKKIAIKKQEGKQKIQKTQKNNTKESHVDQNQEIQKKESGKRKRNY